MSGVEKLDLIWPRQLVLQVYGVTIHLRKFHGGVSFGLIGLLLRRSQKVLLVMDLRRKRIYRELLRLGELGENSKMHGLQSCLEKFYTTSKQNRIENRIE